MLHSNGLHHAIRFFMQRLMEKSRIHAAIKAFGVHFCISALFCILSAYLVLVVWFPYPFRDLAGGLHLFWIMMGIDIVCGPLLTAIIYNPKKSQNELVIDVGLVALIQITALGYGLYSISQARPIIYAFEGDRFITVSASEINISNLVKAPQGLQNLSWNGPRLVGIRAPKSADEKFQIIMESLQGFPASAHPDWWQSYEKSIPSVQKEMKPLADLRAARPAAGQALIDQAVRQTGQPLEALFYLPLTSRKKLDDWIVLLNAEAAIVGYAPVSGF